MSAATPIIEDALAIRMMLQRRILANERVTLAYHENRAEFPILALESERIAMGMARAEFDAWKLASGEKLSLNLEDRGFKFEGVCACGGSGTEDGLPCCFLDPPRSLRRTDTYRLVDFAPDTVAACTFSTARNALLDGEVKGFGGEGLELALRDARNVQEVFRIGEESVLDLPLTNDLHLVAPARVAYFRESVVGLEFTAKADKDLLGRYQSWLNTQQRAQAQRDRDDFEAGGRRQVRHGSGLDLPEVHRWVDRDPLVLVLTESEDFARRLSEGLGRKFGFLSLNYIKGKVRPLLQAWDGDQPDWGRVRLILVHNRLRIASPLELCHQLVDQEKCPRPILLAGTEEDLELKRNRAMSVGAVDFLPVEPFKILSVLRKLDETLRLFEG